MLASGRMRVSHILTDTCSVGPVSGLLDLR
jgi:hypothetical protein